MAKRCKKRLLGLFGLLIFLFSFSSCWAKTGEPVIMITGTFINNSWLDLSEFALSRPTDLPPANNGYPARLILERNGNNEKNGRFLIIMPVGTTARVNVGLKNGAPSCELEVSAVDENHANIKNLGRFYGGLPIQLCEYSGDPNNDTAQLVISDP